MFVLKGEVASGSTVQFAGGMPEQRSRVFVFAKPAADRDQYALTSEYYGWLRVPPRDVSGLDIGQALRTLVTAGLQSDEADLATDAATWSRHLRDPSLQQVVDEVVAQPSDHPPALSAVYLEAHVPTGSRAMLQRAVAFLDRYEGPEYALYRQWVMMSFRAIRTTDDVLYMNALLLRDDGLAKFAVLSAADWADRTSLSALSELLHSSDRDVSYAAVAALSRILGVPGPGYKDFMKDQQTYINDWSTRASREGSKP